MNYLKLILLIISMPILITSCGSDDEAPTRASEKIEVTLNGNTPLLDFSNTIIASDNPLPATSGFTNIFIITSNNGSSGNFKFSFPPTNISPFTITTPGSETLNGPISARLQIDGLNFDDTAANNLTIDYLAFGPNLNDNLKININGTYYLTGSPTISHTISVTIDINRD